MSEAEPFEALDRAFDSSLDRLLRGGSGSSVLFSGGVDSSILALAAAARGPVALRTVGRSGSPDLEAAERAADELGLAWEGVVVGPTEVARAVDHHGLGPRPEPIRSILTSFVLALEPDLPDPVLVGQGADELFGGYAHFRGLEDTEFRRRQSIDWVRLTEVDWPATLALGRALGRTLCAPFLDPEFASVARPLGRAGPTDGEPTKPALRAWARHRGVPRSIAERPKRAIQYGSRISAMVRATQRRYGFGPVTRVPASP